MRQGSAFRLCVYLASQPRGTVLFSDEVCKRFDVDVSVLSVRMKAAKRAGWLSTFWVKGSKVMCWTAGPALMQLIGAEEN